MNRPELPASAGVEDVLAEVRDLHAAALDQVTTTLAVTKAALRAELAAHEQTREDTARIHAELDDARAELEQLRHELAAFTNTADGREPGGEPG